MQEQGSDRQGGVGPDAPLVLVGAGRMGGAMLEGWIQNGVAGPAGVVIDPGVGDRMAGLVREAGLLLNPEVGKVPAPRVIVLAVKPQMMDKVLADAVRMAGPGTLILSVAAGKTVAGFEAAFGASQPIIRAMPNTPAAIGRGMTVCYPNAAVSGDDRALATMLLRAVGEVAWVEDEGLMDAVTAVSGSGPAYVFHLVEAMTRGGIDAGLPEELAVKLARATVAGAGELMRRSGEDAGELRRNVTSPNGTTAAALDVLMGDHQGDPDAGPMAKLLSEAIAAATRRSRELAG
ncbi:pyrroline-5-carboxylate reductase [Futiania mangrovi]|nr:pyrroline-5-carboxylate reductase [Futiania mangrovii]